jgi:3-oxoacyl-[acyl-carrier-protein] synthase-3
MVGIAEIGVFVPDESVSNIERAETYQAEEDFIRDKLGFLSLPRKKKGVETSDLCVEAFKHLYDKHQFSKDDIDCIVVCTQNPDGAGLPHTSAIVQYKLGLKECISAFDISLGCSGYVYGLNIIKSVMEANGFKKGLLFTADPYSKVLDSSDRNTELLFGDAATCTLMSEDFEYTLLKTAFCTDGKGGEAIRVDPATSFLSMKGQDVFMFAMKKVPEQIRKCIEDNGLKREEIDLFLFHQGSKYIVENLRKRLGLPENRAPFNAYNFGNTVSSSIPIMLEHLLTGESRYILLSGFGVGLSWATTILSRTKTKL